MSSAVIQLLVLAGIAIFLILRLRDVLGSRDGFEKPVVPVVQTRDDPRRGLEVIDGGPDADITDHAPEGSATAKALAAMKAAEPSFNVTEFLCGARGAYEMIVMGFEKGAMDDLVPFLARDVYDTFQSVLEQREARGLTVEAQFVGIRELSLIAASFDHDTREAEITVRFVGELTSVMRDAEGNVVEGDANEIRRQKDIWTFARKMGAQNPNWQLVATGE